MEIFKKSLGEKSVWGFMGVGVISLIVGIFMFALVVKRDMEIDEHVPRDVQLWFTIIYVNQNNIKRSTGRFTPALTELELDQDTCRRFLCLLQLTPDGKDYTFRMTKDGHSWRIHSKSPHPEEIPL